MQLGDILKSKGQALALNHAGEWKHDAIAKLREYLKLTAAFGAYFGFDEFREWSNANGLEQPKSSAAWGALPKIACKAGLIAQTDQYSKSRIPSARSRVIRLWRAM